MAIDELLFKALTQRATPEELAAVEAWRARTPGAEEREREMADLLELSAGAEASAAPGPPPRALDLLAVRRRRIGPVEVGESVRAGHLRAWLRHPLPWAAAFAAALACLAFWPRADSAAGFAVRDVTTGDAEVVTIALKDGTAVRLAPRSRLRVTSTGSERAVELTGRAYFAVAKQPDPMRISTPSGQVTVLGTRFELIAEGEDLRVSVVEGTVRLAADGNEERVRAGEIGRVLNGRSLPNEVVGDPAAMRREMDWMGNFFAWQSTPLREALLELGAVYDVAFEIDDPALAARTLTLHASDWTLDEVIDAVCLIVDARCKHAGDVVTMSAQ